MDYFLGMFWAVAMNGFLLLLVRYVFFADMLSMSLYLLRLETGWVWALGFFVINFIIIYIINKKNRLMARGWSLILGLGVGILLLIYFIIPMIIRIGGY